MSKNVKLGKVALNQGGFKGLTVTYSKTEIVENVPFLVEAPGIKYKRPVHEVLRNKFAQLRPHMKKICQLACTEDDIDIIAVTSNEESFIISAKVSTLDDKIFSVNTPYLEEDDYSKGREVLDIITGIYDETMKYLSTKNAKLESKQYLMEFTEKMDEDKLEKIGMTKDMDFEKMAAGPMREMMIKALEMSGAAVMDYGSDAVVKAADAEEEEDVIIPAVAEKKPHKMTKVA